MAQEKTTRHLGKGLHINITQSQSLLNVSELETRAKATVKDINELYTALQGLVPKKSHNNGGLAHSQSQYSKNRVAVSGTDTDTAKSSDDWARPRLQRRYNSEKYPKKTWDDNMNYVPRFIEKPVLEESKSNERSFASDTEAELNRSRADQTPRKLQRHFSLPTEYDDESANETSNDTIRKKSRFMLFRRRARQARASKPSKKKNSSWRSFFSTLSLKRKKSKKHGKNKIAVVLNEEKACTPKQKAKKNLSSPLDERVPKLIPRLSVDVVDTNVQRNELRQSGRKRFAPEPPVVLPVEVAGDEPHGRKNTLDTKSDAVQKKISLWYKYAVKETNSLVPPHKEPVRATRSCENILTDTEIIRKRGTFMSSDTDSISGGDRIRVNVPKTKVRKTRARRNRRREERARFHSLPNVKLLTTVLQDAEKKSNPVSREGTKGEVTNDVTKVSHVTTVKPVEAKLSFGSPLEKDDMVTDSIKLQRDTNASNWLTRQCSKTTISCIRPLQLSLFYSESPSRETVHRSRSTIHRPRLDSGGNPHEFAFKIRRSSSRRRKRRSFKRGQTRLPHQSPFYVPPLSPSQPPPVENFSISTASGLGSKDSGLGSPEATNDKKFATFPHMKRDQKLSKFYSESEDSGWASRGDRHLATKADTGIQTDPVIVMTAVSTVRRPLLPHVIKEDNDQSEA